MRLRMLSFAALLAVGLPVPACRANETLMDAWRREDPRLSKTVSVSAPRLFVGELLEELARQTGVSLAADAPDGVADETLAVFLKDVRLGDALDALGALLSYLGAAYRWERASKAGSWRYDLFRPLTARRLPLRLANLA